MTTAEFSLIVNFLFVCSMCLLRTSTSGVQEYCFPNSFNVTCGRDSVIVMHSARYGRMNKGQCLTSDYFVDCWADVLYHVDRKCSGRRSCFVSIPETTLHNLQPCPKDLLAYLEADYSCQKVENRTASSACKYLGDIPVIRGQSGSLASLVTNELEFGSSRCPWLITVPQGQKIKVTLLDFGVVSRLADSGNVCHVYAKMRETVLSSETTVCGSRTRERSVYVSETNQIEVTVMNFRLNEEHVYFVLNYEATGCVDPTLPRASWMKRSTDTAVISCNFTTQAWHIVCQGSSWFGKVDNCTTVESGEHATYTLASRPRDDFHYGLLVAVITGLILGVVIGVAMLAIVIACHTRRKGHVAVCHERESPYAARLDVIQDCAAFGDGKTVPAGANNQYEYAHVCGFNQLTSAAADDDSFVSPGRGRQVKPPSADSSSAASSFKGKTSAQQVRLDRQGLALEYRVNCQQIDALPFCQECEDKQRRSDDVPWSASSG